MPFPFHLEMGWATRSGKRQWKLCPPWEVISQQPDFQIYPIAGQRVNGRIRSLQLLGDMTQSIHTLPINMHTI